MGQQGGEEDHRSQDPGDRLLASGGLDDQVGAAGGADAALFIHPDDEQTDNGKKERSPLRFVPKLLRQRQEMDKGAAAPPNHQPGKQTEEHPAAIDPQAFSAEDDLSPQTA